MTYFTKLICAAAALLAFMAPAALANPAGPASGPVRPATTSTEAEYDASEDGPPWSDDVRAELGLIFSRDIMPIMAHATMAEFIWQADPAAACQSATAAAEIIPRLKTSLTNVRQKIADEGDDPAPLDVLTSRILPSLPGSLDETDRFCKRAVAQDLSAEDRAAFKKGAVMVRTIMAEMSEAVTAKLALDDAKACVSLHVVAATASDFDDFIKAEATASEVMARMSRSRALRWNGQIREMAEDGLSSCEP